MVMMLTDISVARPPDLVPLQDIDLTTTAPTVIAPLAPLRLATTSARTVVNATIAGPANMKTQTKRRNPALHLPTVPPTAVVETDPEIGTKTAAAPTTARIVPAATATGMANLAPHANAPVVRLPKTTSATTAKPPNLPPPLPRPANAETVITTAKIKKKISNSISCSDENANAPVVNTPTNNIPLLLQTIRQKSHHHRQETTLTTSTPAITIIHQTPTTNPPPPPPLPPSKTPTPSTPTNSNAKPATKNVCRKRSKDEKPWKEKLGAAPRPWGGRVVLVQEEVGWEGG